MKKLIETFRSDTWIVKITLMSFVLGMLLAVSLKTQWRVRAESGVPTTRSTVLASAYRDAKDENKALRDRIEELQKTVTKYQKEIGDSTNAAGALYQELKDAKLLAGLSYAKGPGVTITLQDSKKKPSANDALDASEYLIHDMDVRTIVNELRIAGAEAISVNDQRLIASSAIRCNGPVILVNNTEEGSPFVIKAIGNSKTLYSALAMPGGVLDGFPDTSMVEIRQVDQITMSPYTGAKPLKYATSFDK